MVDNFKHLENKKIGIIGATGFVGGRLFELFKKNNINPRILVRNFSKSAELSVYDHSDFYGDLLNHQELEKFINGLDICFNCAHDFTESQENMLKGIQNLVELCLVNNTKIIHLSSVAVHEPFQTSNNTIDENSKYCDNTNIYGSIKLAIEKLLTEYQKNKNLDLVIFRPTNIYGPKSKAWTIGPCNKLLSGEVILTEKSKKSINNLIYVDDVCFYMINSTKYIFMEESIFLINGPDSNVSWYNFYDIYQKILKKNSLIIKDEKIILKDNRNFLKFLINGFKNISMYNDNKITSFIIENLKKLPNNIKSKLKIFQKDFSSKLGKPIFYPNMKEIQDYRSTSYVNSDKAAKFFNFTPTSFKQGMVKTKDFIEWYFEKLN